MVAPLDCILDSVEFSERIKNTVNGIEINRMKHAQNNTSKPINLTKDQMPRRKKMIFFLNNFAFR